MKRLLGILFTAVLIAGGLALPAQAELQSISPGLDANGFTLWVQSPDGVRLASCLDPTNCNEGAPFPIPPDPLFEFFYYNAGVNFRGLPGFGAGNNRIEMNVQGLLDEVTGLPIINNSIFIELDGVAPNSQFVVTTPYGNPITVTSDAAGAFVGEFDSEGAPLPEPAPAGGNVLDPAAPVGPFLLPVDAQGNRLPPFVDPLSGLRFLQDVAAAELTGGDLVTGSPTGRNFVSVAGPGIPGGVARLDRFAVVGQLPDILDRRAELQTRNGKFQVTGTSSLPATTTLTITGGTGPTFNAVPLGTAIVQADGTFRSTVRVPRGFPAPPALGQVNGIMINPGAAGQPTVSPLVIR
jgi:hypothetical protein